LDAKDTFLSSIQSEFQMFQTKVKRIGNGIAKEECHEFEEKFRRRNIQFEFLTEIFKQISPESQYRVDQVKKFQQEIEEALANTKPTLLPREP